jgi:hypothetical protein
LPNSRHHGWKAFEHDYSYRDRDHRRGKTSATFMR